MEEVVIVDSGGANLASLQFALERLGARTRVLRDAAEVFAASRVILPGVGSAPYAMQRLEECSLTSVLRELTCPVLGISLGIQLLYERTDEGHSECLGVIRGVARHLKAARDRPLPHMGWNQVMARQDDPLLARVASDEYVYFVHSFAVPVAAATLPTAQYGAPLTAVARSGNFWCTRFHPERFGRVGARVLQNFLTVH